MPLSRLACVPFAVFVAALLGCQSFGEATTADGGTTLDGDGAGSRADGGHPSTGAKCGTTTCAATEVCCFEANTNSQSCTSADRCKAAPLECTLPSECHDQGTVCCGFNDRAKLLYAACVVATDCDASGPQDWLCDPLLPAAGQCTQSGITRCVPYPFSAPPGLSYCTP